VTSSEELDAASLEAGLEEAPEESAPEVLISNLLRAGVASSLALVMLGIGVMFTLHPDWMSSSEQLRHLTRTPSAPCTLAEVVAGMGERLGRSLTMVGLLLLMGLPVARVALSLVLFAQRRDRAFTAITAVVLGLLVLSFALGRVTH
jgi:uncharacterized membrane protein